eukprot:scaffold2249_cov201-Alexandrium_tamarense.AAC.7
MDIPSPSLRSTWNEFITALHAPTDQEFNPFYWLCRLSHALLTRLLDATVPCRVNSRRVNCLLSWFRPFIPALGMALTLLCGWSYFSTFRQDVIIPRWCNGKDSCYWEWTHSFIVIFFIVNIIGQYLWSTFTCPGVVKPPHQNNTTMKSEKVETEQTQRFHDSTSPIIYHPSPYRSHCKSCEMERPPRAHHCRICKRCIVEYDHHCPWINGCIGYNNYRSFLLLVFYVMLGCTYGSLMLGVDFYNMMKKRIQLHGFSIMGAEYRTGLLDLPLPWTLWKEYKSNGRIPEDVVLRAAFPFMLFVSVVMCWFFMSHLKLIASGLTTLEQVARPETDSFGYTTAFNPPNERRKLVNPFDHGPRKNLQRVMGTSMIRLVLPLPSNPTPSTCNKDN